MATSDHRARRALAALAFSACTLVAGVASATPNFPAAIQSDLALASTPDCTLCHVGDPGTGTVKTPFGLAMRARGLVPFDTGSLSTALAKMKSDAVDSDGDCVTDVAELQAGKNPNDPSDGTCGSGAAPPTVSNDDPRYGCGAEVAPRSPSPVDAGGAAIAGLVLGAALVRRRRPRT